MGMPRRPKFVSLNGDLSIIRMSDEKNILKRNGFFCRIPDAKVRTKDSRFSGYSSFVGFAPVAVKNEVKALSWHVDLGVVLNHGEDSVETTVLRV